MMRVIFDISLLRHNTTAANRWQKETIAPRLRSTKCMHVLKPLNSPSQCPPKSCSTLLQSAGSPLSSSFSCRLPSYPFSTMRIKKTQENVFIYLEKHCCAYLIARIAGFNSQLHIGSSEQHFY